jgi:hypothetical protein
MLAIWEAEIPKIKVKVSLGNSTGNSPGKWFEISKMTQAK